MYAIFRAGGSQRKAEVGDRIRVDRLKDELGAEVSFPEVLMVGGDSVEIGTPTIDGRKVVGKVVTHGLGKKLVAYKYRQRTHARRKRGFRWHYTEVEITAIAGS